MAAEQFRVVTTKFPDGDNAVIFRTLMGSNLLHLPFLGPGPTNASSEWIDPWGTPYRIELLGQSNSLVHSAGRDRKFGDRDDYVFDGAKRAFVKQP